MNLAKVIGTVWCTVKDPSLEGMRFLVIEPQDENGTPRWDVGLFGEEKPRQPSATSTPSTARPA